MLAVLAKAQAASPEKPIRDRDSQSNINWTVYYDFTKSKFLRDDFGLYDLSRGERFNGPRRKILVIPQNQQYAKPSVSQCFTASSKRPYNRSYSQPQVKSSSTSGYDSKSAKRQRTS